MTTKSHLKRTPNRALNRQPAPPPENPLQRQVNRRAGGRARLLSCSRLRCGANPATTAWLCLFLQVLNQSSVLGHLQGRIFTLVRELNFVSDPSVVFVP